LVFKHELEIPALDCLNELPRPEDQESWHFSGPIQVQPAFKDTLPIMVPNAHHDAFDLPGITA